MASLATVANVSIIGGNRKCNYDQKNLVKGNIEGYTMWENWSAKYSEPCDSFCCLITAFDTERRRLMYDESPSVKCV